MSAAVESSEHFSKEHVPYIPSIDKTNSYNKGNSIWSLFGVSILIISYAGLGSVIFISLESKEEALFVETSVAASKPRQADVAYSLVRTRTVDRLWSITEDLNILYKDNWTRLATQEVKEFQEALLMEVKKAHLNNTTRTFSTNKVENWTYSTAFLYSLTLMTTIGYVAPPSEYMKLFALAYACVGIGIVLLYLSITGEVLSRWLRCTINKASSCFQKTKPKNKNIAETQGNNKILIAVLISLLTLISYMILGTVMMKYLQAPHWSTIDAFYFCFATLSTIGYGQLFPNSSVSQCACATYILIGMALVAMSFNLVQVELMIWFKSLAHDEMEHPESIIESNEYLNDS